MPLDPEDTELGAQLERLHPYLRALCDRACLRAQRLHAESIVLEHVIGAAMDDEECAAHAVAVHAFADPETISSEMLALSPGVMVVGSRAALPFSPLALEALEAARAATFAASADEVTCAVVLAASAAVLADDVRAGLRAAGLDTGRLTPSPGPGGAVGRGDQGDKRAASETGAQESWFGRFSKTAKQALSLANRAADGAGESTIGPAQILLGCLSAERALEDACGLSHTRARAVLVGRTGDPSELPPRTIPVDPTFTGFLGRLPAGGGTLDLLSVCHAAGSPELSELLGRHKVSPALLERCREAFEDPDPPV